MHVGWCWYIDRPGRGNKTVASGVQTQRNASSTPPLPRRQGDAPSARPTRTPVRRARASPCGKQPRVVAGAIDRRRRPTPIDPTCICMHAESQRQTDRSYRSRRYVHTYLHCVVLCFSWIGTAVAPPVELTYILVVLSAVWWYTTCCIVQYDRSSMRAAAGSSWMRDSMHTADFDRPMTLGLDRERRVRRTRSQLRMHLSASQFDRITPRAAIAVFHLGVRTCTSSIVVYIDTPIVIRQRLGREHMSMWQLIDGTWPGVNSLDHRPSSIDRQVAHLH